MAKIERTGVYRHADGTAVYLVEGEDFSADMLKQLNYDAEASKSRLEEREPDRFGWVANAPQDQKAEDTWSGRMVSGAPENKAMTASPEVKSDAALADDAAKKK
jgi:hypothetical protein